MNEIVISEIQIIPVKPQNGLLAFASCIYNNQLALNSIAIYGRPNGCDYRLVYPMKILPNGKEIHIFHPINKEAGEFIKNEIILKYEDLMKK